MENFINLLLVMFYLALAYLAGFLTTTQFLNAVGAVGKMIQNASSQVGQKQRAKYAEKAAPKGELAKGAASNSRLANYARTGASTVGQLPYTKWKPTSKVGRKFQKGLGTVMSPLGNVGGSFAEAQTKRISGAMKAMDEQMFTDDERKEVLKGGSSLALMKRKREGIRNIDDQSLRQAALLNLAGKGKMTSDEDLESVVNSTPATSRGAFAQMVQDTYTSSGTNPARSIGGWSKPDAQGNYHLLGRDAAAQEGGALMNIPKEKLGGLRPEAVYDNREAPNSEANQSASYTVGTLKTLATHGGGRSQIKNVTQALLGGGLREDTAIRMRRLLRDAAASDQTVAAQIHEAQRETERYSRVNDEDLIVQRQYEPNNPHVAAVAPNTPFTAIPNPPPPPSP